MNIDRIIAIENLIYASLWATFAIGLLSIVGRRIWRIPVSGITIFSLAVLGVAVTLLQWAIFRTFSISGFFGPNGGGTAIIRAMSIFPLVIFITRVLRRQILTDEDRNMLTRIRGEQ